MSSDVNPVLYVGSWDSTVYALNSATGAKFWNYTTGDAVLSPPALAGGSVFVGSRDRSVYAIDAAGGSLLWSYATGGYVDCQPAVADGAVFFGSFDGKVYALKASNGSKLWDYRDLIIVRDVMRKISWINRDGHRGTC